MVVSFCAYGIVRIPLAALYAVLGVRRIHLQPYSLMKGNLMDPNTCYVEMTEAMEEVDRLLVLARQRAVALHEWIGGGGFYPQADSPELVRMTISQIFMRTDEPEEA